MEHDNTPANASAPETAALTAAADGLDVLDQLPALRRYALSLTRDATDAEDLVHDALLRAYEKQGGFRAERGLRQWLLSIVHNTFVDRWRSRRAERRRIERLTSEMRGDPAALQHPPEQDHALRLAQVRQAFMSLPEEQRAVLHLVTIEGLGYGEAAQALDVPVGTVMSRLARARAALRAFEDRPVETLPATPTNVTHLRVVGGTDDNTG
ncbi:sigma-70 family RNA polymerase sigma factor [Pseudochelatococcus sp. B33]